MGLFSKPTPDLPDFSMIGVDMHNHVLPGIDDGAPTWDESRRMLEAWIKLGFRKIITTPHVISSLYPNTKAIIQAKEGELKEKIREWGLTIEVQASGEYQLDYEYLRNLEVGEMIGFGPKNYLLVELPLQQQSFSVDEMLFQTQLAGFEPIIAHPERYGYLGGKMKSYEHYKNKGYYFQMNLNSLNGLYGIGVKKTAEMLIEAGMIDFVGSDAHHVKHLGDIPTVLHNKYFGKLASFWKILNKTLSTLSPLKT